LLQEKNMMNQAARSGGRKPKKIPRKFTPDTMEKNSNLWTAKRKSQQKKSLKKIVP